MQKIADFAVQIHGGGGMSSDHPLAAIWAAARTLRIVDGPDEVHLRTIARGEEIAQSKNGTRDQPWRGQESKGSEESVVPGVGKPRL